MLVHFAHVKILHYTIFHTAFYNHSSVVYTYIIAIFFKTCLPPLQKVIIKSFFVGPGLLHLQPSEEIELMLVRIHFFYL